MLNKKQLEFYYEDAITDADKVQAIQNILLYEILMALKPEVSDEQTTIDDKVVKTPKRRK